MRQILSVSATALAASLLLVACNKPDPAPIPPPETAPSAEAVIEPTEAPATDTPAHADGSNTLLTRFTANGFSPAWRAEIDGESVKLDVPEHGRVDPGFTTLAAERLAEANGVEFTGKDGEVAFTLTIDGQTRCATASDADGNTDREFNATLTYGRSTYHGCADRN